MKKTADNPDDWGSFEKAEQWRKEAFAARTPAQRLQWLKSALRLHYQALEARRRNAPSG